MVQTKHKYLVTFIALMILPITGLSIDIYVPSLPAVSQYFNVDKSYAQLSITLYMLGFGALQIPSGVLVDSFGRKTITAISLFVFVVFSLLIPMSANITQLLMLRLGQGVAVAFFSVAIRSVIADLFSGYEFYKIMNYVTILWSIGPIIAPAIGGYLQSWIGWHASFYFLAIYGLIMLLLHMFYMPETIQQRQQLNLKNATKTFKQLFVHKEYMMGLICLGLLYSLTILFSIVGPFLIQSVLHYSPIEFGHMALFMGLAWFLGNLTNRISLTTSAEKKINLCYWLMLLVTISMLVVTFYYPLNIYNILICTFVLIYLGGIVFPNYYAKCIALFANVSGAANSLMGTFLILIAGMSSGFGTLLTATSELPLAVTYLVITLICLLLTNLIKQPHTSEQN